MIRKCLSSRLKIESSLPAKKRFIGQTEEDRNSNFIKQTSYGHSDRFDERELLLEEERLCQRECLFQERQRRQRVLEEKEEPLQRAELELIKKEKWLKKPEDIIDENTLAQIDDNFRYQDNGLELKAEKIRIRKRDLEKRKNQLRQTQNAPRKLQINDTELDAQMEQERILQELQKKQEMLKEKGSIVDRTLTEKSSLHQE